MRLIFFCFSIDLVVFLYYIIYNIIDNNITVNMLLLSFTYKDF